MGPSLQPVLSNVSPQTANTLSSLMLVLIAVFLISGPIAVYLFRRNFRKSKAVSAPAPS